jgi:protease I
MTTAALRVAILVEHGFDDDELAAIAEHLRAAGAQVTLLAPIADREYTGRHGRTAVVSTLAAGAARADMFDAVVIPGGYAPDRIRMRHAMVDLVRATLAAGKPVAAIGHGAQVLISADALGGRTVTCWPSIAVDVKNAGGMYVDRPVVEDSGLITARKADDVPRFASAILRALGAASSPDGIQSRG